MDIPILGQSPSMVFVVCVRGHVNEAPQHPGGQYLNADGSVDSAVYCARCMFDFHATTFGGVILPRETTRKEAEWKAKEMKDGEERENSRRTVAEVMS